MAIQHWELLAKLVTEGFVKKPTHNPDVTISLIGADERDKLECWMSVVWMVWRPQPGNVGKELEDAMDLLGKERRGTVGKRIEQWKKKYPYGRMPEAFQRTCDKLARRVHFQFHWIYSESYSVFAFHARLTEPSNEGPLHLPPPAQSSSSAEMPAVPGSNEGMSKI